MSLLERLLVNLNAQPWHCFWRMVLGAAIPPLFRVFTGREGSVVISLTLFVGLLVLMWLIPAVLRRLLPFAQETKQIWKDRRAIAKRYDSYQWRKLFWIGLGLLLHGLIGSGLNRGEWVIASICLIGGGGGLYFWQKVSAEQNARLKASTK